MLFAHYFSILNHRPLPSPLAQFDVPLV